MTILGPAGIQVEVHFGHEGQGPIVKSDNGEPTETIKRSLSDHDGDGR
jgi:hypothetical protein